MNKVTQDIERVARAICIADNCDPDADGHGMGHSMPQGARYKLWEARVEQAIAAMEELMTPSAGMIDDGQAIVRGGVSIGWGCMSGGEGDYCATELDVDSDTAANAYRAMLLRALGR